MDRYNPPNHTLPHNNRLTAGPAPLRGGRNPDEPRDRRCAAPLSNARARDKCPFCERIRAGEYDNRGSAAVTFEPLNPVTAGHRLGLPGVHVADPLPNPALPSPTM